MSMPTRSASLILALALLAACQTTPNPSTPQPSPSASGSNNAQTQTSTQALSHYAELVHSVYSDSLSEARKLQTALDNLVAAPSADSLAAARQAWLKARVPYGQSEGFRFAGGPIDNEQGPEGQLNAWPLDEVYIDSVQGQPDAGIIHNLKDYPEINEALLRGLNEQGGDKNISTGYHAIEFLLWGQDLSVGPGAGERPFTDYTTATNASRRGQYLKLLGQMLVKDLETVTAAWAADNSNNYRASFLKLDAKEALGKVLKGIGTLSASELASERMATPLDIGDREEEHSCFSDNTHNDVLDNTRSIRNVLLGSYTRADGSQLTGPGIISLIRSTKPELADQLSAGSEQTLQLAQAIQAPFDQEIRPENSAGKQRVLSLVQALQLQGRRIVDAGAALGIQVNTDL